MARQYQIPGGPYVNAKEEGREYQLSGYGYLNEAPAVGGAHSIIGSVDIPLTIASTMLEGRALVGDVAVTTTVAATMAYSSGSFETIELDFEENSFADFDDTTNITNSAVNVSAALAGSYGMEVDGTSGDDYGIKDFAAAITDDEIRLYCKIDLNNADFTNNGSCHVITAYNSSAEPVASIDLFRFLGPDIRAAASMWRDDGTKRGALGTTDLNGGTVYELEARIRYATGASANDGEVEIFVDTVSERSFVDNDLFNRAKPDKIRAGFQSVSSSTQTGTFYLDDIRAGEGTTSLAGKEIIGDITVSTTIAATFDYTFIRSITGDITVGTTIAATLIPPSITITGDVTITSAIVAGMDYTRNASIIGDVTVLSTITAGMVAAIEQAITGSVTVTPSIAATMLEGRVIDGSIAVGSTIAAAMDYTAVAAITGDITITTVIAADFNFDRVFIGDVTVTFDIMAGLVPDTGINTLISGVGIITAALTIDSTAVEQTFRNEISPLERFVPDEFTAQGRQWLQDKLEEINSALVRNSQGVPLTPIQNIQGVFSTATFPLGTSSSFHHPSYGLLHAVFCEFASMVGTVLGSPVGFDASQDVLQWKVTNDFSNSAENALVGLLAAAEIPTDGKFGWVITHGANIHRIGIKAAESNNQFDLLGWSADNEISSTAAVKQMQQITGGTRDSDYGYNPGELLIRT